MLISNKHFGVVFHNCVSSFVVFAGFLKIIALGWGFSIIFRGRCFALSLCLGGGNSSFQKIPQGRGVVRLGTD